MRYVIKFQNLQEWLKKMSDLQRQHPAAALANAFDIIRGNFITLLIIIFVGGGGERADFTFYWIMGTIFCLLVWGGISWYRFTFQVTEGELHIEQGVIIRKKLFLTSDRIQVIDFTAGPVQRLFGLVAVEVKTAGSSSKEAKINAITKEKAEKLKALLRTDSVEKKGEDTGGIQNENKAYSLTGRDLLFAASTSGRFGVALSLVAAAFSQVDQLLSEEQIIQFVENHIPTSTSATLVVGSVVTILLVAWLLSFISTIIRYFDFSVEVKGQELLISRGLFERTQLTIPINRIQAVQVKEGVLRQPFGYASLVIESAGYGESEGNSTTLFPLLAKQRIYSFIEEVIPEFRIENNSRKRTLTPKALRRYLLRMLWVSLLVFILAWSFIPYGIYAGFIIPAALWLGYRQYLAAGVLWHQDTMVLSWRLVAKTTAIVKKYRIQAVQLRQNPFQSRLNLWNLTVHVASGNQGRSFTLRELSDEQVNIYWSWISFRHPKAACFPPVENEPPDKNSPTSNR